MLDARAIARQLNEAGALADAIAGAVREAAEPGDHVTREGPRPGLAALEARPARPFAGAMPAQTAAIAGGLVAILRLPGT